MKAVMRLVVLVSIFGFIVVGCSSTPKEPGSDINDPVDVTDVMEDTDTDTGMTDVETAQGEGIDEFGLIEEHPLDAADTLLAKRVLYFDLDSALVKDEFSEVVEAHAGFLAENPDARLTLEGHADERGTREYNLGLGERRAQAVSQFLQLIGATSNQLTNVSYGEERPVDLGHDDIAYQANRRVELVYER
ncbi:Tol-Pal system peptidoglycan-associated lipoprotein PAL [hydrothermal vent metagenome]|uniref:Tol-Pal system peptidoglycan-associated lipoprotein PAL n=1 Tax=hydrothermal vent metagenome TaxID=652676 RepID=A0A3B0YQS2_9ZZZZ